MGFNSAFKGLNEELFSRRIKACDVCKVSGTE